MSLAKALRANSTVAERRMWRLLFSLRTDGFHFRKQAPIGPYVADMACHHAKLIIEVDGDSHGTTGGLQHDEERDAFLEREGYTVLRFGNRDVLSNSEGVLTVVMEALSGRLRSQRARHSSSPTLPTRGRVPVGVDDESPDLQSTQWNTLPLVGRVGEGDS